MRGRTAGEYAASRLARIYSVAVPALALTYVLDTIGRAMRPELYHGFCCDQGGPAIWQFLRNLVFGGNVWFASVSPGSDIPYWSLGYEAWYYLAFGLFTFLPVNLRWIGAAAAMVAAGPGIAVLLPLWLLGVWCQKKTAPRRAAWLMVVGGIGGIIVAAVLEQRQGQIYDAFNFSPERLLDYAQDYLVGGCFAVVLVGIQSIGRELTWLSGRLAFVRWAAGATFALYLFHVPLIRFVVAVSPWPVSGWASRSLVLIGVPLVVLALAEVTERRKVIWRKGFGWLMRTA